MRNENINDPVLMKMRAQQDQRDRELEKSIEPKVDFDEDLDLIQLVDNKEDIKQCIEDFYTSEGNNYCLIEHKNLL